MKGAGQEAGHTAAPASRATGRRRLLLAAVVGLPALALAVHAGAQSGPAAGGPRWNQLSPQQREALAPLAGQWETIPADSKRKWIEIAAKYPQLSPEGQERVQARMAEFVRLTPEQRRTARENFQRAYEMPRDSRESAVQQFQTLPDDEKKALNERGQQRRQPSAAPAPQR